MKPRKSSEVYLIKVVQAIYTSIFLLWATAIAPWLHLRLPTCGPRFESQAHHLCLFNLYYRNCNEKWTKINKEARIGPFLKKIFFLKSGVVIVGDTSLQIGLTATTYS